MDVLNNLVYPAILAILTSVLGYVAFLLKENRKTADANAKGTMLLLRREIMDSYHKHVELGEPMTALDYADVDEIHSAYKALGGNGLTDKLYTALKEIEIGSGND